MFSYIKYYLIKIHIIYLSDLGIYFPVFLDLLIFVHYLTNMYNKKENVFLFFFYLQLHTPF